MTTDQFPAPDAPTDPSLRPSGEEATPANGSRQRARRAAWAGGVGTVIEYYDYSLYGFLAVTIGPLFFPASDPTASIMAALLLFASGFLLRPIGGLIFGRIGDMYGRRTALIATLLSMGVASTFIGLLPTYASIGVAATVLIVILRGVQGLSAGGELGGSMTFIAESSEQSRRGAYGAATAIGITVGFASAGAVVGAVSLALSDDTFADWGWRVPFLLSLPLCLFCLWLRRRAEETLTSSTPARPRGSLLGLLRADGWSLLLVSIASIAVNGMSYIGLAYLSVHLIEVVGAPATSVYWVAVAAILLSGAAAYFSGRLADRYGLMTVAAVGMAACALVSIPGFALMSTANVLAILVAYTGIMGFAIAGSAPMLAVVPLLFRSEHRYTGAALGWNIGAITAGATTPLAAFWLVENLQSQLAPAVICIVGAIIGISVTIPIRRALKDIVHV